MFSTKCVICVVPEMGTIQGFYIISLDSAICAGTDRSRTTQFFTNSTNAKFRDRCVLLTFEVNSYSF
jgi:hypothetical protein